jgi:multiple sugar transport system permease protein
LAVYQAFREKYPDIQVASNAMALQFEGAAGEAPLLMSIAGGTAPDVIHVNTRQSGSYIKRGFLRSLDGFIEPELTEAEARERGVFDADVMYREELEARIQHSVWDATHRVDENGNKHFYLLPFNYQVRVLAYNKALFQEVGLDPVKGAPETWEDLTRVARLIQDPSQERFGMLVSDTGGASWVALPFFFSMGSRIVQRDAETGQWQAKFNDAGAVEAADYYLQLVDGPWMDPDGNQRYGVGRSREAWHLWDKGRVGMVLLYINDVLINIDPLLSGLNPEEVGLVPVPKSPRGTSVTELHMRGLGICATTTDPDRILAAWRFIRFVGSPEAEKVLVRTYVENGYGSYLNPEKLRQHGYDEYVPKVPVQWAETLRHALTHNAPEPFGENCQVYIERASKPLQTALAEDLPRIPDRDVRLARLQELYDEAVADVNEKMLGQVPEDLLRSRRKVAAVVLGFLVTAFVVMFGYVWRLFTPPKQDLPRTRNRFRKFGLAYLMLMPAVAAILVFNYYPLLRGAVMAFQDYNVLGGSEYVGLDNFASVLFDSVFWISLGRTLEYVAWSLLLVFFPPIVLAMFLSEIPAGKVLFRVLFYLPAVVSGLVVMLMWKMFFDPGDSGTLNQVLGWLGIGPQKWLQDKSLAMVSIIIPLAWAGMGPGCLIYMAALKTVPEDLYEAAAIDGAGVWSRIRHITLPTINTLIMIQLIFVLIGTFQSADNVLVMTGGGPDFATHVVGLEIFYNAYVYLRFGAAIAIAWILGFLLIGMTLFQMRRLSNMTFTTAGGD